MCWLVHLTLAFLHFKRKPRSLCLIALQPEKSSVSDDPCFVAFLTFSYCFCSQRYSFFTCILLKNNTVYVYIFSYNVFPFPVIYVVLTCRIIRETSLDINRKWRHNSVVTWWCGDADSLVYLRRREHLKTSKHGLDSERATTKSQVVFSFAILLSHLLLTVYILGELADFYLKVSLKFEV